ncbi:poly(A) RNA polymerase, mitochondrial-like [Maniola jurtina]|uniref:poly(A) RNA polymerase, mitochondrial-like n=1 Tax=Maniola jurtina TaxID=191418 RepID=UPI001E689D9F|nr:poly(A) RNA polymerase, mitochondrial-like [Maniola jurtina]
MSVLLQTGKVYLLRKAFNNSFSKYIFHRKKSDVSRKFISFDEIVAQRRAEARRSLVVQVNSESSFNELYGYCSKYASIDDIHHYKNSGGEHFMLIEFSTEENLKDILQSCSSHQKDLDVMGVQSPFLWFRATTGVKEKYPQSVKELAVKDGSLRVNEEVLFEELLNCETVSDQIQMLYDRTVLNDIGVRLRYMVARQLEIIFSSLYANIKVQPFGSSVNGFGKMGCDLDLVLTNTLNDNMTSPNHRLVYQEKKSEGGRSPWQRHMELVGALLEMRVPGASRVQKILNARVPIVKYSHDLVDVDCDLCCNNTSGVYMSELLWQLGSLDPRVRPLTCVVRCWARAVGLTNAHPGRWLTNFPLTLLVLFFLQQKDHGPVLPTLKHLVDLAGKDDIRIAEENLNCTFLRDLDRLPSESYAQNDDDLQTLLFKFFEFYSQFDFQDKAISLNEGKPIRKPNSHPLYVVNPLEQALNVSRNVSYEECERLRLEVRNAAWHLESCMDGHKSDDWGILGLVEQKSSRGLKKLLRVGNSHRLVSVKDLFNESDDVEPSEQGIRSKMEKYKKTDKLTGASVSEMKFKEKKSEMRFKNSQTAKEVYRIRRNKLI